MKNTECVHNVVFLDELSVHLQDGVQDSQRRCVFTQRTQIIPRRTHCVFNNNIKKMQITLQFSCCVKRTKLSQITTQFYVKCVQRLADYKTVILFNYCPHSSSQHSTFQGCLSITQNKWNLEVRHPYVCTPARSQNHRTS